MARRRRKPRSRPPNRPKPPPTCRRFPLEAQCLISFTESDKSVSIGPGETIHGAAAKLGLHIPKACGMGICGTCKVLKKSGEVVMDHNGGITEEDEAEGYILSCCSIPQGDVQIEF